jgi:hypothetical protein
MHWGPGFENLWLPWLFFGQDMERTSMYNTYVTQYNDNSIYPPRIYYRYRSSVPSDRRGQLPELAEKPGEWEILVASLFLSLCKNVCVIPR